VIDAPPPAVPRRPDRKTCSDEEWERWLEAATERADPFMAWLGVVFALLVGFELAVDLAPPAARALTVAGWVIWAIFALEFLAKLALAPKRLVFLRRHWLQLLGLLVPTLRVLRFVRLLRLGRALPAARVLSSSYRTVGTARRLLRSRLAYVGALAAAMTLAVAQLAYLFERDHPDPVFESFGDALLWALATVLGMQGDPVPHSVGAHIVMLVGFLVGLVVIASLAGTLGAFLLEQRDEGRSA
jgi:voltage-gated potassium channel